MNNTGKFIATVSVNGRALDSAGNIINRDNHGLPTMWLNVIAGRIPNRQTITGTLVQRMGLPIDDNGIIAPGEDRGRPFAQRIIYGQWLHQSDHETFGPQYTWSMIKDMTDSSPKEIEESCEHLGPADVFTVERPNLPEDYVRRSTQHIGRNKLDPQNHSTNNQQSRVVEKAIEQTGGIRVDTLNNPEVEVKPGFETPTTKGQKAQASTVEQGAEGGLVG